MPSQAMQDVIDALRDRQRASAGQAPRTLDARRAAFTPGDRLHPVPDDVVVREVTVDLTSSGASMTERAGQDPISTPAMLRQFASDYLARADPKTPLASPLFASLRGPRRFSSK